MLLSGYKKCESPVLLYFKAPMKFLLILRCILFFPTLHYSSIISMYCKSSLAVEPTNLGKKGGNSNKHFARGLKALSLYIETMLKVQESWKF